MVVASLLRHLLSDDESLSAYFQGNIVLFDDVKRRMLLSERNENRRLPDHHYRLVLEKSFSGIDELGQVLKNGIYNLAHEHLLFIGNRIHVQQPKLNGWQSLITKIPPLILQSSYMAFQKPLIDLTEQGISFYFKHYLLPNFKFTALPYTYIPQLEHYIAQNNGLNDLHVHLNGATETDNLWQEYLTNPSDVYNELNLAFLNPKVKEQLEQESHLFNPGKFYTLLRIASRIRKILFDFVFPQNKTLDSFGQTKSIEHILSILLDKDESPLLDVVDNPFGALVSKFERETYPMSVESLMYVILFNYLTVNPRDSVSSLFHFYLLILGLSNRLLVQQNYQYGFEQFQKHTLNGLRESSEKTFQKRFLQMHGNEFRNISFIEGRFSPKDTQLKNLKLLDEINKGWLKLLDLILEFKTDNPIGNKLKVTPELRLIAHFIKRVDGKPDEFIRHKELRIDTWKRAEVLALLIQNQPQYGKNIVGIDAAASEFDTPPEVFAPVFRLLRRKGIRNFTYHAGEDFHHLLSGLRSVFEAVFFNDLRNGDRIGHATATGLTSEQWANAVGSRLLIRKGEWLDDMLFCYHIIVSENIEHLKKYLPNIVNEIDKYAADIYHSSYSINTMVQAWLLRRFCPILLLSESKSNARLQVVFNDEEWDDIQNQKINDSCLSVIKQYHQKTTRAIFDEIIEVDTCSLFSTDDLQKLQIGVLEFLHHKEIVIETLPTSNVKIGHHPDYSTYHLWNWIRWENEGFCIPPIIVGTDDTGIFATNIYNEYSHIYCQLTNSGGTTHNNAMKIISRLNDNGKIYRFDSKNV